MTRSQLPQLCLRPLHSRALSARTRLELTADSAGHLVLATESCPRHLFCRALVPRLRGGAHAAPASRLPVISLGGADATLRLSVIAVRAHACFEATGVCEVRSILWLLLRSHICDAWCPALEPAAACEASHVTSTRLLLLACLASLPCAGLVSEYCAAAPDEGRAGVAGGSCLPTSRRASPQKLHRRCSVCCNGAQRGSKSSPCTSPAGPAPPCPTRLTA